MKAGVETTRFIHCPAPRLAASAAVILLCAGAALAQSCPNVIGPGETQSFGRASSGSATPISFAAFSNGSQVDGNGGLDFPAENKIEAVAATLVGAASSNSASAQINYQFCVQGPNANHNLPATISSNVSWNGILAGATVTVPGGTATPAASVTMSLYDFGTSGFGPPILVATTTPLNTQLGGVSLFSVFSGGFNSVTGSGPALLNANLLTRHLYQIQYTLDCEAPTATGAGSLTCFFGSDVTTLAQLTSQTPLCPGGCSAQVSSIFVVLGKDSLEDSLEAIAAAKLALERENAEILGILNEIKALLTALQSDPPPVKAKTGDPKPGIRPVRPRTMDAP